LVGEEHPLKQGLKLRITPMFNHIYRLVGEEHPLKQGLKLLNYKEAGVALFCW